MQQHSNRPVLKYFKIILNELKNNNKNKIERSNFAEVVNLPVVNGLSIS